MSAFSELADELIDATFDQWSDPAEYTPPGGGAAVPCRVIVDARDANARPEDGRPSVGQVALRVRVREVRPAARGSFVMTGGEFNGRTFTVANRPLSMDAEGKTMDMWGE